MWNQHGSGACAACCKHWISHNQELSNLAAIRSASSAFVMRMVRQLHRLSHLILRNLCLPKPSVIYGIVTCRVASASKALQNPQSHSRHIAGIIHFRHLAAAGTKGTSTIFCLGHTKWHIIAMCVQLQHILANSCACVTHMCGHFNQPSSAPPCQGLHDVTPQQLCDLPCNPPNQSRQICAAASLACKNG